MCVPLNLEHYAEYISPVTSMDMHALRTGNYGGALSNSIVYLPVVDGNLTQTRSSIRACYAKLVPVRTLMGVEQVEVAEVEVVVLLRQRGWIDLEISHGCGGELDLGGVI